MRALRIVLRRPWRQDTAAPALEQRNLLYFRSAAPQHAEGVTSPTSSGAQDQAELIYARAYERVQCSRKLGKTYASKWLLARRLFKAKMARFPVSVDRGVSSPLGQLESYHTAKYELATAALNHECFLSKCSQIELKASKALVAVRDAEIARLKAPTPQLV